MKNARIAKTLSLVLVAMILISTVFSVTTFAAVDDGICKDFKYTVTDENSAVITEYIGSDSSVKFPDEINGHPVKEIGDGAFKGNYLIESTEIPNGVKTIDDYAFNDCTKFKNITIPESVNTVGEYAFARCNGLEKVTIESGIKGISNQMFKDCSSLKEVILPNSIENIGRKAFSNCSALENLSLPDSVNTIDDNAFYSCSQIKSISTLAKKIGNYAFSFCSTLDSLTLSDNLETVGAETFKSTNFEEITIPSSVSYIGEKALETNSIKKINVDENNQYYTYIDGVLFNKSATKIIDYPNCAEAEFYSIPQNLESIGDYAIICNNLNSVYVPQSVKNIGNKGFGFMTMPTSNEIQFKTDFMAYGAIGSAAETFCTKNDLAFFTDKPSQNFETVSLNAGENAVFNIKNANPENVVCSTSDKAIADVDNNGKITANSKGTMQIIASVGIMNFICTVNVKNGEPKSDGYVYSGFDTSGYSLITRQDYQKWKDEYYNFNKSNPDTRLDNPVIYCYTTSEYVPIMAILVGGSYLENTKKQMGEDYHQYETIADNLSMELSRFNANSDMLLYSGTDVVSAITGKTSSLKDMKDSIGTSYIDGGVVSTSVDHGVADHFGDGIYHTVLEV